MRQHSSYWVFMVHRVSGIALALFLPLHFWTLGNALQGSLAWTEKPLVKLGDWLIVVARPRRRAARTGAQVLPGATGRRAWRPQRPRLRSGSGSRSPWR
jgi:hypothetical protein